LGRQSSAGIARDGFSVHTYLMAGICGALVVGAAALYCWYRARLLERRTERLLARISSDIDQLVLRTLREQNLQLGPRAPQPDSRDSDSVTRAA
jgi:hypothetical protein